jgi:hypothetical protein
MWFSWALLCQQKVGFQGHIHWRTRVMARENYPRVGKRATNPKRLKVRK